MTALIATAAHRPTACESGSSDRHHANTEHHYCVVVDQRHKVIKRLCTEKLPMFALEPADVTWAGHTRRP